VSNAESNRCSPPFRRVFPPQPPTPNQACSDEKNKGRWERRQIFTKPADSERICFPHVAQVARVHRHLGLHAPETIFQLTSREPERFDAAQWLVATRQYWGVENGLHQRLDVSTNEDLCRVRNRNAVWVLGMFRRLAVSLFAEWKGSDPKRRHATLTDFHSYMDAEHARNAIRFATSKNPRLRRAS
jgi:hypothetical protein